jgi:hypothetical protein
MDESKYIRVTNRVKISAALTILRDVLGSESYTFDWGVSEEEIGEIIGDLAGIEARLFEMIVIDK